MKKNYIAPEFVSIQVEVQQMMALSLQQSKAADSSDVLVRGSSDWDIFGDSQTEDSGSAFED